MRPTHEAQHLLASAVGYLRRGWRVVPVPYGKKAANAKGWPSLRLDEAGVRKAFKARRNIGVLLGEPSGGLMDVDLDCAEALALAEAFLPATGCIFGRPGKPRSHWLYACEPIPQSQAFKELKEGANGPEATTLVELRGTRLLTIFPPSIHEGTDERILFDFEGKPAQVGGEVLRRAVGKLAAAALIARHWPRVAGCRQSMAMALAGGLVREGWLMEDVGTFIGALAQVAHDEEADKRAKAAEDTFKRHLAAGSSTGWRTLAQLMDAKAVDRVREFLGLGAGWASFGTALQASRTHDAHDLQIHNDTQRFTDLTVSACEPPSLEGSETARMKVMQADVDARRSPRLPMGDYVAAAVEHLWHLRQTGKAETWTTRLWGFLRDLKGHPDLKGRDAMTVIEVIESAFKSWPMSGIGDPWLHWTEVPADEARVQIAYGWPLVRYTPGGGPLDDAVERARQHPLQIPPEHCITPQYVRFLAVAGWLQALAGDRNIYLPCRSVAVALSGDDRKHDTISRWIRIAEGQGYLCRTRRGEYGHGVHPSKRTADEFRFDATPFPVLVEAFNRCPPEARNGSTDSQGGPEAA